MVLLLILTHLLAALIGGIAALICIWWQLATGRRTIKPLRQKPLEHS